MNETEQAVVRWLREMSLENRPFGLCAGDWPHSALSEAADAIERGEHKETEV